MKESRLRNSPPGHQHTFQLLLHHAIPHLLQVAQIIRMPVRSPPLSQSLLHPLLLRLLPRHISSHDLGVYRITPLLYLEQHIHHLECSHLPLLQKCRSIPHPHLWRREPTLLGQSRWPSQNLYTRISTETSLEHSPTRSDRLCLHPLVRDLDTSLSIRVQASRKGVVKRRVEAKAPLAMVRTVSKVGQRKRTGLMSGIRRCVRTRMRPECSLM